MDRFWLYAGLLAAAGVGYAVLHKPGPRLEKGGRLLLVGDSLSVGLHPPMKALAAQAGIPYAHCGRSGARIDEFVGAGPLAGCVTNKLASLKPTVVVVVLGTNDEAMHVSYAPKQLAAARALLAKLEASGAKVLWVGPAKIFTQTHVIGPLSSLVPHWFDSSKIGVPLADGIGHSTPKGYAGWAAAVWKYLCRSNC